MATRRTENKILGIFDWHKVKDGRNQLSFAYGAFDRAEKYFDPQDVQDLIDARGALEAVQHINYTYSNKNQGSNALVIVDLEDGTTSVYCASEFPENAGPYIPLRRRG